MEYRHLGRSGFKVPVLSFGAGTFGGKGPLFSAWGDTGAQEARRLVDICLEAGAIMLDTADVYSDGESERILGEAIKGRRSRVILSTKAGLPSGEGPTVSTIVIGARNEGQLRENLGAVGWTLTPEQMARLDTASDVTPAYPYWPYRHQQGFAMRNPPAVVSDPRV